MSKIQNSRTILEQSWKQGFFQLHFQYQKNPEQFKEFKEFQNHSAPQNTLFLITCIPSVIFLPPPQVRVPPVILGIPHPFPPHLFWKFPNPPVKSSLKFSTHPRDCSGGGERGLTMIHRCLSPHHYLRTECPKILNIWCLFNAHLCLLKGFCTWIICRLYYLVTGWSVHGKDVGQTFLGCIFGIFRHLDAAVSENSKVPHQLESTNDNNLFSLSDNAIRQLNKPHTITKKSDINF